MISIKSFTGIMPKLASTALPDNAAKEAHDCDFTGGRLQGLPKHRDVTGTTAGLSAHVYTDGDTDRYFTAPFDGDFVRSPVQQDDHKRVYWTGEHEGSTFFRVFSVSENPSDGVPGAHYQVGVADFAANEITLDGGIDIDGNATGVGNATAALGGLRLGARTPAVPASEVDIGGEGFKLSIINAQTGDEILDITSDLVSVAATGAEVNGWHTSWDAVLAQPLSSYSKTAAAGLSYKVQTSSRIGIQGVSSRVSGRSIFKPVGDSWVLAYVVVDDGTLIGTTTGGYVGGDAGTPPVFTEAVPGQTFTVTAASTATMVFKGYAGTPLRAVFSVDGTDAPLSLVNGAVTDGETYGTEGFETKFLMRLPATYKGVRFQAELELNKQANQIWSPDLQINAMLSPKAGDDDTLTFSLSFGDASMPGEAYAYIATFVNKWGEESAPLPPMEIFTPSGASGVELYLNIAKSQAKEVEISEDRVPLHGLRIYRTPSGVSATTDGYYYVGTVKFGDDASLPGEVYLNDTLRIEGESWVVSLDVSGTALGSQCATLDMVSDVSELQKLQGLTTLYNGILAAFKGNEVWYSEPYQPWAWNRANVHTLPHKIVSLLPHEQGVYILTDQYPYFASGATPDSMMPTRIPSQFSCLNRRAATVVNGQAVYLSPDGPVLLDGASAKLENFVWSRETWRNIMQQWSPTTKSKLVAYGHRIIIYFTDHDTRGGFMYDVSDNAWSYFTGAIEYGLQVPAGSFGQYVDEVVVKAPDVAVWRVQFGNTDETRLFDWESKDFIAQKPRNFGAVQLFGAGEVMLRVYADDVLRHTVTLTASRSGVIARLPSGFTAAKWSFRLTATVTNTEVTEFNVATSVREFQGV